ncbi:DUF58 domain-containing protein [Egbenema bharatensis]|uniref:DUF58 domain-containing protein n=1 Tax=Egbenema bharatensis TaxID=3463334 RepID=UPI003A89A662
MLYRLLHWCETRWIAPAYSSWLMVGLALFFFGAATNTMAGWLYVMSGIMLALLLLAAFLAPRSLQGIRMTRQPIAPVSMGEPLTITLKLDNQTSTSKSLLQVEDILPPELGKSVVQAIDRIPAENSYLWSYGQPTTHRGVYHWQTIALRTAAPLGLFWCRREQSISAKAIVYPTVLSLSQCPLIDQMGQNTHQQIISAYHSHAATEGLTRTLRPYRWGDAIRLVHWRTSARYGELRVRELETYTGGQSIIIGLDSATQWSAPAFEQAVITAASLYFYVLQRSLPAQVWTAKTGLVQGDRSVLETLAAVQFGEARLSQPPPQPLIWISQNPGSLSTLSPGSRWILWQTADSEQLSAQTPLTLAVQGDRSGLLIHSHESLQSQLQTAP